MQIDRRTMMAIGGAALFAGAADGRAARQRPDVLRPVVSTRTGRIMGRVVGDLHVFRGIPYALPPVGKLRFRRPVPLPSSRRPVDAGAFGAAALQPAFPAMEPVGPMSEDCLTLNILAPAAQGPHPVLFIVHGGGNFLGASSQSHYDGTAFAQDDIVVVSANYRLGAFGFMELGGIDPAFAGSGLNGLLDLATALRWVRENIAAFGGNPHDIALIGQSAGAKNECALAAMPSANRLFRRMLVQSGGGLTTFGDAQQARPVAEAVIAAAGLKPGDVRGLASLPAAELLAAQGRAMAALPLGFPFRPTVDGHILPLGPVAAARAGMTRHLDVVIGTARDESAGMLLPGRADKPLEPRQLANLDFAPMRSLEPGYERILPGLSPPDRRIRQLTAEEYWIPSLRFAEAHAGAGGRVWMYRFDWKATDGPATGYASHGGDMGFVFGGTNPWRRVPQGAAAAAARTHDLWSNWARAGTLAVDGLLSWPTYDLQTRATMIFDRDMRVESDPARTERLLWDGVL